MFVLRPTMIRPSTRILAKKEDFIAPTEAPGEGNRRFPTWDEGDEPGKKPHPIKKFIMKVFKIEEIDHEKFRKESVWAIKPRSRPRE